MNDKATTTLVFPEPEKMQERIDELTRTVERQQQLIDMHRNLFEKNAALTGFARVMLRSTKTYTVGEVAKIISDGGYEISTDKLFAWMRGNGYLGSDLLKNFNMPMPESMAARLFVLKEKRRTYGPVTTVTSTVMVTTDGLFHFVNKFLS